MHAHERRPAPIRLVEEGQFAPVRIGPARADEDGLDCRLFAQVFGKGGFHWFGVAREVEVVGVCGGGDEGFDFGEGVRGDDVDGLEAWGGR